MDGKKTAAIVLTILFWLMFIVFLSDKYTSRTPEPALSDSRSQPKVESPAPIWGPEYKKAPPYKKPPPPGTPAQARVNLAALLQAGMQAEGRKISVSATGNNYETLEFSSGLIFDGSNTFRAVERETTLCADCVTIYMKLGFKQIVIRGSVRKYRQVIRLR